MPFEVVAASGLRTAVARGEAVVIGRGPLLGITDKLVSREHLRLACDGASGALEATSVGANQPAIERAGAVPGDPLELFSGRGDQRALHNGDTVFLVGAGRAIPIFIERTVSPPPPPYKRARSPSPVATTAASAGASAGAGAGAVAATSSGAALLAAAVPAAKRRAPGADAPGADAPGADDAGGALTRARLAARPPCRYGDACFRQRLSHFADFLHSPTHKWGATHEPILQARAAAADDAAPAPVSARSSTAATAMACAPVQTVRTASAQASPASDPATAAPATPATCAAVAIHTSATPASHPAILTSPVALAAPASHPATPVSPASHLASQSATPAASASHPTAPATPASHPAAGRELCLWTPLLGVGLFGYAPARALAVLAAVLASQPVAAHPSRALLRVVLCIDAEAEAAGVSVASASASDALAPLVAAGAVTVCSGEVTAPPAGAGAAVVHESNWRLRAGGGGRNAAMHACAGEAFGAALREAHGAASVGVALLTALPASSPLAAAEAGSVRFVLSVVPPCMNSAKAFDESLEGDYARGDALLACAWRGVLRLALDLAATAGAAAAVGAPGAPSCATAAPAAAAADALASAPTPARASASSASPHRAADWAHALCRTVAAPERYGETVVWWDTDWVVLRDLYPKARYHFLVLPRLPLLRLTDLRTEHAALVRAMTRIAKRHVLDAYTNAPSFAMGFHAVPSMLQLHMHVISRDFAGSGLKKRTHYLSFTTGFFLTPAFVLERLERDGRLDPDELAQLERLTEGPLACHRCRLELSSMPALRSHLDTCVGAEPR